MAGQSIVASITVPKNTPIRSPVQEIIEPSLPIFQYGEVMFPLNAAGLVGVRLLETERQFAPTEGTGAGWYTGDNATIPISIERKLVDPYEIRIQAYNLDDTFARTIEVRVIVVEVTLLQAIDELTKALRERR